jgi:hypothetical protein
LTDTQDLLPIIAVGGLADDESQEKQGQKMSQSHQAEIERAARQGVDLPAHSHGQHLVAHDAGHPG